MAMEPSINALRKAVVDGDLELVQSLLQKSPHLLLEDDKKQNNNNNQNEKSEPTFLLYACCFHRLEIVKFLVESGAPLETVSNSPDDSNTNYTALQFVSRYGFADIVSYLVEQGANMAEATVQMKKKYAPPDDAHLTTTFMSSPTPLKYAVDNNHLEAARVLLKAGASAKGCLVSACSSNPHRSMEMAELLKEFGVVAKEILLAQDNGGDAGSALHAAAYDQNKNGETGDVKMVEWLLDQGASIEAKRGDGSGSNNTKNNNNNSTLLVESCKRGSYEVARVLIKRGANLQAKDRFGLTPLHIATFAGQVGVVALLLENGADAWAADSEGDIPVYHACVKHFLKISQLFFKVETKTKGITGVTLLHVACTFGCIKAALRLIFEGENNIHAETAEGQTPLHFACEFGHLQIVRVLLNKGAKMDAKDKEGFTSLHMICGNGHLELAEMFIKKGADIEAKQRHGWTPLQLAAQNDRLATVRLLVHRGANVHAGGFARWTPLLIACKFGCREVAEFLLDGERPNINARNKKGWTPLHVACRYGQMKIVRLLLQRGADMNAENRNGRNPLQFACKYGQLKVVRLLLERGAYSTVQMNDMKSPEQLSRKYGHTEITQVLVEWRDQQE